MFRFKPHHLLLALGLIVPAHAFAATFCVAVSGGFGKGGTSYISPSFAVPASGLCKPWTGFTKTATTVIGTATGTGCVSSNGKVLTLSILNADPANFGTGKTVSDYIRLCPKGVTGCPVSGEDQGNFNGAAKEETCTANLLNLPVTHD